MLDVYGDFPQELRVKTVPIVGVSGLDTVNNAIHKAIWETFNNLRRTDKVNLSYKLIGNDYEFPILKPKRTSYEWYIPKGILKKNWMKKHLYQVPSAVIIFYDLDWKDIAWNEKIIECASKVQSMRAALDGRNTKILLVLIQNVLPLPAGDDTVASERAASLCSSCELQSNSLFVLPHGDHLQGYAYRLETAFFEFVQNYYHNEIRNIKGHKEHLNKNNHQYLFVRHQFKLGFLYELKQDSHTAHKHYTHSYNNLLEIRVVDTIALEIRTIAGFLNYKLCKLLFSLNLPRDAISQFKAHIEKFKIRIGFQELAFEHYAWLASQHCLFGELFEDAVKMGVAPVQTQHPGIYFQQAAEYTILRKTSCHQLCENVIAYPNPDPFENTIACEFYGQRPWKTGKVTPEQLDPQLETNGILALQFLEKKINFSRLIISLYGLAIQQYKTYKCPRTRRYLILQMAEEYYSSEDYGKCLTLLTHMLYDMRTERWQDLLCTVLEKALMCAYIVASIQDYLTLTLEVLGLETNYFSQDQMRTLNENIKRIFLKQIPLGDSKISQQALQNAYVAWQNVFSSLPLSLSLDMGSIPCCIESKVRFTKNSFEIEEIVSLEVYIRNSSSFMLTFCKISVSISSGNSNIEYAFDQKSPELLTFKRNETKKFLIELIPDSNSENNHLQVTSINLMMGNSEICAEAKLSSVSPKENAIPELSHFRCTQDNEFEDIQPIIKTLITPRTSRLEIEFQHSAPALEGEWYKVDIKILNKEPHPLKQLKVEISPVEFEEIHSFEISKLIGVSQKLPLLLEELENINNCDCVNNNFYIRIHKTGEKKFELKISYILSSATEMSCVKTEILTIPVVKPFEVTTKFLSPSFSEIEKLYCGEDFYVMNTIKCLSPWPINIENTELKFEHPIQGLENNSRGKLKNILFREGEIAVDMLAAMCSNNSDQNITIGQYCITWKRESGETATSQLMVVGPAVEKVPLHVKLTTGAFGILRTPLLITYHFKNVSQQLIKLQVNMESSEAFMFSGRKQFGISILPQVTSKINYNLYPLITGRVALPKLTMITESDVENSFIKQEELDTLLKRTLPRDIFIMPQKKVLPEHVCQNSNET